MNLSDILNTPIDSTAKGMPSEVAVAPADVAKKNWNLLRDDLNLPLLVLKDSVLEHNIESMAGWCKENNFLHAPHGKTTMCPQIFKRQLDAGAWGITVANVAQALVCIRFGVTRILMANQLAGAAGIRSIAAELARNPGLEFYCLVDSVEGVKHLAEHLEKSGLERPVRVLLEWGHPGWRTGVRSREEAEAVLAAVEEQSRYLMLCGIEGFEGVAHSEEGPEAVIRLVREYLEGLVLLARDLTSSLEGLKEQPLFSIGGTEFLDLVHEALLKMPDKYRIVLRSGSYVTIDHGYYTEKLAQAHTRSPGCVPRFEPALELWAYVHSLKDKTTAFLNFGKRDAPYDLGLPIPLFAIPAGGGLDEGQTLSGAKIVDINDQHGFLTLPDTVRLSVGDRVVCGISHPCTAFDKWRVIPVVDEQYRLIDLYRTYF